MSEPRRSCVARGLARARMPRRARALVAAALLCSTAAGCDHTGTISVTLATAPDASVLDAVTLARLTLTRPPAVVEAERDADGSFALVLDVPAADAQGELIFEGFDAGGELVAYGRSGPLPTSGVTVDIALYVAPPLSLRAAPAPLATPRADMGVVTLPYGALLAGGRAEGGDASAAVEVYSVYQHRFQTQTDLPAARVAPAAAAGALGTVYLFGGLDADGAPSDALYGFAVDAAQSGAPITFVTEGTSLARSGAVMAALGQERFAVTGAPPVLVDGRTGRASALDDAPALAGTATSAVVDGVVHTLFAGAGNGESGAILLVDDGFTELAPPAGDGGALLRTDHATALLPDGSMLVLGGRIDAADGEILPAAAVRFLPPQGDLERADLVLATPRHSAAVTATEAHLVVAGGVDAGGALVGDAEIFDARTLAPVTTLPMVVPRRGAAAVPLPNGQVLIAGGVDEDDAPASVAELFTPAP